MLAMSRASVGTAAPISVGAGIGATEGAGLGRAWGSSSQPPTARIVMASSAGVLVSTATVTRQNQARGRGAVCDVGLLVREPNQRDVEPRRGRLVKSRGVVYEVDPPVGRVAQAVRAWSSGSLTSSRAVVSTAWARVRTSSPR